MHYERCNAFRHFIGAVIALSLMWPPDQEAKPDAKLTCNLVRMRNKRPLAYQHQHPSFWRQLEILRKLKIGSSMGNFL